MPRRTSARPHAALQALLAILAIAGALLTPTVRAAAAPVPSALSATLTNFDSKGNQVTRYDVLGNAIDAHDGMMALFNGTYYLYGTSYDCGYEWNAGSKFCGFKVYTSPDMTRWTDAGYAVSPGSCANCFRPHVIYNVGTRTYVMWANVEQKYRVYTSTTPTGPFTRVADTTLSFGAGYDAGDEGLFVDSNQDAYIAHTITRKGSGDLHQRIEKLNSAYTAGTGLFTDLPNTGATAYPPNGTEAPSLFRRGSTYYSLIGPTCAYCTGTATIYATSADPLGPWSPYRAVNPNSCGGQPSFVFAVTDGVNSPSSATSTQYVYGSDLWGAASNEALANYYWAPLDFDDRSSPPAISAFTCRPSASVTLPSGSSSPPPATAGGVDQTSGTDGFRSYCDIRSGFQRRQSFVAGSTGTLDRIGFTTFQRDAVSTLPRTGPPDAPLVLDVLDTGSGKTLASVPAVDAGTAGWSPRTITVMPNVAVVQGRTYAIVARSATHAGCYGFAYNDNNVYPSGLEAYSNTAGSSYVPEPNRSLKFWTTVAPAGSTFCTADAGVCNFNGTETVSYGADGQYTSKTLTGPVPCTPATFGTDPAPGVVKACYVTTTAPADGLLCAAAENSPGSPAGAVCAFNGTQTVWYGANGRYTSKTVTGPVPCTLATFGTDPAPGVVKACYVTPLIAGPPAGYTLCAPAETGVCTFTGTQSVAYGANGQYTYRTTAGPVVCDLASFDSVDPALGTVKSCFIGPPSAPAT